MTIHIAHRSNIADGRRLLLDQLLAADIKHTCTSADEAGSDEHGGLH